ncbi:MAG: methyltransferase domain-containing protein [Ardenticatenaceae bacterium]|nr:methyltransferase domain-containing protein [Ardenticatenaceae bacterium]
MFEPPEEKQEVIEAYDRRASGYDLAVKWFDVSARFGFNISGWRRQAVGQLNLKPGDTIVDIGCGTGLNFPMIYEAVGSQGTIIGVDLSEAMLAEARQMALANGWENVQLVCADATQFEFPPQVDAVISAFTLILVPGAERVIARAVESLVPGGRLVILDMAWPRWCPLWWRHVLFFLRSYGVTAEVLRRRSWEAVQQVLHERLSDLFERQYWFGFFYLAAGTVPEREIV